MINFKLFFVLFGSLGFCYFSEFVSLAAASLSNQTSLLYILTASLCQVIYLYHLFPLLTSSNIVCVFLPVYIFCFFSFNPVFYSHLQYLSVLLVFYLCALPLCSCLSSLVSLPVRFWHELDLIHLFPLHHSFCSLLSRLFTFSNCGLVFSFSLKFYISFCFL